MYTIYTGDGPVHTSDASEALVTYQRVVDAGAHPSIWRDAQLIVHIALCRECASPVLMTHTEVSDWASVLGRLEDGVLCQACSIKVLGQRQAQYDEQEACRWELELMPELSHGEQ